MSQIKVTYNGRSGDFRVAYRPSSVYADEQFIKVRQGKLEEVNIEGKKASGSITWNLAGDGNFSKEVKFFETDVRRLTYTATMRQRPRQGGNRKGEGEEVSPETRFHLFLYIGSSSGDKEITDEEAYGSAMLVPAGSLKFGVKVENWPFQSELNRLSYHLTVEGSGDTSRSEPDTGGANVRLRAGGFGEVVFPREVEVQEGGQFVVKTLDGEPLRSKARAPGADRKRSDLSVVFPYGETVIRYDPDVVISAARQDAQKGQLRVDTPLQEEQTDTLPGGGHMYYTDEIDVSTGVGQGEDDPGGSTLKGWQIAIIAVFGSIFCGGVVGLLRRKAGKNNH